MGTAKECLLFLGVLALLASFAPISHGDDLSPAAIRVTIQDESGSLVNGAHVYIFSNKEKKVVGTREVFRRATFDLPPGEYQVYAAQTTSTQGIINHYASPVAHVRLSMEEPTSVILCIQRAEVTELYLSDAVLKKMGLDAELARYLN